MGKIRMGIWNCNYCNKKAIPGNLRECPGCGRPRGEGIKFDLPENAKPVEDETKISRNPDWLCSYCNSFNPDEKEICISCGHARENSDLNYFQHHNKQSSEHNYDKSDSFHTEYGSHTSYDEDNLSEKFEEYENLTSSEKGSKQAKVKNLISAKFEALSKVSKSKLLICLAMIAVVIFSIIAIAVPRTETMKVEKTIWEYSISIEKYQTVNESDWFLPDGARVQRTAREIHHYETVLDHYETKSREVPEEVIVRYEEEVVGHRDLGNGYFEDITQQKPIYETRYRTEYYEEPVYREDPVYKTKYYYEIERWLYDRTETSTGFDRNPYWPDLDLSDNERISDKDSKYFAQVIDKDQKSEKISVNYDEWGEIEVGDEVTVKKWVFYSKIVFD